MGELILVDNPQAEVATLVDVDEFKPLPIAAAGPARLQLLSDFQDACKFDLTEIDPDSLRIIFGSFLDSVGFFPASDPETAPDQVEPGVGSPDDDASALAQAEAAGASDVPAAAPADTDTDAARTVAVVTVRCWNCNGTGVVEFGDDQPPAPCNMCKGTGKVQQPAA